MPAVLEAAAALTLLAAGCAAMVGLVAVKVELDVQGLPAQPLPGDDARERAGVPAKVDAKVKAEQVKVESKSEVPGERHLAKRAAVKAELRVGGLPTHGGAEELTARLAEHGHGWTEPVKAGHLVQREQVVHGAAAGCGVPAVVMNAEVKSEQRVNVEIKTEVKSARCTRILPELYRVKNVYFILNLYGRC